MAKNARLIVGLGNPGSEYEDTRHNIGFAIVDAIAEKARITFKYDGRADAFVGEGRVRGGPVLLAKPLTYMNRSGDAVKRLAKRYQFVSRELFVIVDDINLVTGKLRLRQRGSAGGHNGVQDIIDCLGTDDFPRLRIGIGNDFPRGRQADYVLSPFSVDELPVIEEAVQRGRDAAITFVTDGIVTAMNRFN